ncbi:MAG: flagellar motor protein MotB [Pseudochelatococcus sp.]|jgi:chemotaxis protein MotB|uniref:flagellar motor protein MotB n=1 Tax=Pseudochelatococcus sp. TaxID=2020869 RepID=UPI003D8CB0D0
MDKSDKDMILIQRRHEEPEEHGAHGIWKIAYADFMTALMAFFLIMWLLSSTSKEQRASVANYFNPIKLSDASPARKGVVDPRKTIRDSDATGKDPGPTQTDEGGTGRVEDDRAGATENMAGESIHTSKPKYPDGALFVDPYAILAKIAEEEKPVNPSGARESSSADDNGASSSPVIRDPFDPSYWRLAPEGRPSAISQDGQPQAGTAGGAASATADAAASPASEPPAADAARTGSLQSLAAQAQEVSELRADIADALKNESRRAGAPDIKVEGTDEGILISLTDADRFSMFALGSAEPNPAVVRALARIAASLADRPGTIVIRGHTDSVPFKSDTYDNWRLSSARAHMASYMLMRGGLKEARIERIEGYADRLPRNSADGRAPENRRIEILLREKRV